MPIIVTGDPNSADDKALMASLIEAKFKNFIRLDVFMGNFYAAQEYLLYGTTFPEFFVMSRGYLLKYSWTKMSSYTIDQFLDIALTPNESELHETTLAQVLKDKISLRKRTFQPINRNQLFSGLLDDTNPQNSPPSVTGPERKSDSPPPVESQPNDKQKGKKPYYGKDEPRSRKTIKIGTPSPYQGNQHQTLKLKSRNPDYDSEKSTSS